MSRMFNPPHPGQVLQEWLADVSVTKAAEHLDVTRVHLSRILNGHANVTADMALRLSALLGTTPQLWVGLQSAFDLWQAKRSERPRIIPLVRQHNEAMFA